MMKITDMLIALSVLSGRKSRNVNDSWQRPGLELLVGLEASRPTYCGVLWAEPRLKRESYILQVSVEIVEPHTCTSIDNIHVQQVTSPVVSCYEKQSEPRLANICRTQIQTTQIVKLYFVASTSNNSYSFALIAPYLIGVAAKP